MIRSARAGAPADAINIHATAVILGDCGILITGPSGAGKTVLALELIADWRRAGRHAALVADDQVFAAARGGRLVCFAPANIAGLAETRGFGPAPVNHMGAAVVDMVVELAEDAENLRAGTGDTVEMAGIALPKLRLPQRDSARAILAINASLSASPFC